MLNAGATFDCYTLTRQLGTNAFGPVWAARESIIDRLVSVNFLASSDEFAVARFMRAISLLSRLNHSSIAVHAGHGFYDHRPYLATEYLQGPTLATLIAQGGRMDEYAVLKIAQQVADSLDYAWRTAGVIHRNLGPQTIVVDLASIQQDHETIGIRIIDFGHALGKRLINNDDAQQVQEEAAFQKHAQGEIVGTPMTMSPEQILGKKLTVASDMYALGVTMYVLLTGKAPFGGEGEDLRKRHLQATPLDLLALVPGIQPMTAALVKKLLNKQPMSRFADWAACTLSINEAYEAVSRRRPARKVPQAAPEVSPSTVRMRKTATFERTPIGEATPYGPASETGTIPLAPSKSYAELSADDIRVLAAHAAKLRESTPASDLAAASSAPAVDDGLTNEQRMALWATLFRNPAIKEASLELAADPSTAAHVLRNRAAPSAVEAAAIEDASDGVPIPDFTDGAAVGEEDEEPAAAQSDVFTLPSADDEPLPQAELGSSPGLNALAWKITIEILRDAVLGIVVPETGPPPSATRRLTRSLMRFVSNREPTHDEILAKILAGKFDDAQSMIERIEGNAKYETDSEESSALCLLRARLAGLSGDFGQALEWAQESYQIDNIDPLSLTTIGVAHLHFRRSSAAVAIFDEVTHAYPKCTLGWIGLAAVYLLTGAEQKFEAALAKADRLEHHVAATRLQALRCRARGDTAGELAYLEKLITGTPADWEIRVRMHELTDEEASGRRRSTLLS